tara:strand:+ start:2035 stop:3069 length:1035 start_codon:yes stop_codon:yes gene_type:complete
MVKTRKQGSKKHESKNKKTTRKKILMNYSTWKKNIGLKPSLNLDISKFIRSYKTVRSRLSKLSKKDFEHISKQVLESLHKQSKKKNVSELFELYSIMVNYKLTDKYVESLKKCGYKSGAGVGAEFKYVDSTQVDGKCLKHLEIDEEIGSGMFGTTYKVKDGKHIRALKIQEIFIKNAWNNTRVPVHEICGRLRQIKNEIENLKYAGSIGISPKVYDDFICVDHLQSKIYSYILMDYIDGELLQKWLEKNRLTKDDKDKLLGMLNKLHKKKILHQDLHGNNIIVSKNRRFYLIDYGLSHNSKDLFKLEKDLFIKAMSSKQFARWSVQTEKSDLDELSIRVLIDIN